MTAWPRLPKDRLVSIEAMEIAGAIINKTAIKYLYVFIFDRLAQIDVFEKPSNLFSIDFWPSNQYILFRIFVP